VRRKWWIVGSLVFLELLVFVAIVAILWGWGGRPLGMTSSRFERRLRSNFVGKTDVRVHTLDVRPAMEAVDLHVQASLKAGSMTWKVIDSDGVVRWEGEVSTSGSQDESRRFEPVAGVWKLEIALEGASGHYDVRWTGSN
jgi:hypothetical protein